MGTGIAALTDPNNILSKRSVYFEFDRFEIKDEYRPLIEAQLTLRRINRTLYSCWTRLEVLAVESNVG